MPRFVPRYLGELETIPKATRSKTRVTVGVRGGELFTFKVKTSVRAPNVTNLGWGVTFGHTDHPLPRSNSPAEFKYFFLKWIRLWLTVTLKRSYLTVAYCVSIGWKTGGELTLRWNTPCIRWTPSLEPSE